MRARLQLYLAVMGEAIVRRYHVVKALVRLRWKRWFRKATAPTLPAELPVHIPSGKPLRLERIPMRSSKAEAKRMALAFARRRSGRPDMSWKSARKYLDRLGREERDAAGLAMVGDEGEA